MFKKIILSSFIAISSVLLLAACGSGGKDDSSDSASSDKVKIRFSAWDKFPDNIVEEFNKEYPNIEIELVQIPDSDYSQKINQMLVGGTAPDVILSFETDLPKFAETGSVISLDDYLKDTDKIDVDDFIPAVNKLSEQTGGNYGLPWAYASEILFYNKDMFDAAGVDYPTKDWTWDDFEKAAEKLTIKDGNKTTQWGADALTFRGLWWSLAGQGGDDVVKDGKLSLSSGLKDALTYQDKLTNSLKVSPEPSAGDSVADLFASGQAAMARTGSWMTGQYKDVDFNWDIETLPKGERAYNSLHTGFYTINSKSEHKDEAWKFVEFMMSEQGQTLNSKWGNNPSALKTIAEQGAYKNSGENGPTNWEAIERAGQEGEFGYVLVNASTTTNLVNQFDAYLLGTTPLDEIFDKYIPNANKEIEDNQ
ncbi:ABC transporter substrate-binding protein [Enterococcus sp. JM4C]|uniref:ABC transporter substrate-binding protein n=1 Tax=Candidatus Enterococcus huntleyi TaxID=1857217 RepID=UPI00137A8C1B|nr:sugar ABC transporter substrate-binding protein [Enterococcus sp. JM4C]KAF1297339.1 ABC transporter substrate-binding protein [Enterococcus sp. JM4C]